MNYLNVSTESEESIQRGIDILTSIKKGLYTEESTTVKTEPKKEGKKTTSTARKKTTEKVTEKPAQQQKEDKITDDKLRALMPKRVEKYRDEIKAKFKSFGAKNISTLKKENYEEFHTFLLSLEI